MEPGCNTKAKNREKRNLRLLTIKLRRTMYGYKPNTDYHL